jgi:hypothetical protein
MGSAGWQSPLHVPSPSHSSANGYMYPDPDGYPSGANMGQVFYSSAPQIRRPQSTEPSNGGYDVKARTSELWAGGQ